MGRQLELCLEDSATDDAVAAEKAEKLVREDAVDVILGGIYSSTRQAIKRPGRRGGEDALHLSGAVRGSGVRPAHLLHRSRAGAAGRPADSVADGEDRREEVLPSLGRLHLAARPQRARHRGRQRERRRDRGRGVLPARPHRLHRDRQADQRERCRDRLQHDRAARRDAVLRGAVSLRVRRPRRPARLHLHGRELPQPDARRPLRRALQLPRLLPGGQRPIQRKASRAVQRPLPRRGRSSRAAAPAPASTADCGSGPPP